jgi:hypothetical protein
MSYIINSTNPFVSIKLTEIGRQQLALGQLNFSYYGIGDSEINYGREAIVDANSTVPTLSATTRILRPFDQQPNLKYFITPENDINPYKPLTDANKHVIKAIVNNQAEERGFFSGYNGTYTTFTGTTYSPYNQKLLNTKLTGGTQLDLSATTAFNVGDLVLLKVANNKLGNVVADESTRAIPNLWFKIQAKTATNVTLDRNLPNYSAQTASTQVLIYRGGEVYNTIATGNTTAYWDTGTLSFQANDNITCSDVPVWNMNNVWRENPAGITGLTSTNLYEDYTKFGSYPFLGFMNPYTEYLQEVASDTATVYCNSQGVSYFDEVRKSLSIIHFTNNSISNLYGEFLYIDATNKKQVEVYLPELMYHRRNYRTASGITMGMKFIASGGTQLIGTSQIQYVDLMEDSSMISSGLTAVSVGRVFPQLKTIIFDNDEIVSALSYKSNRNWTLPELSASLSAPSGGTSTGILDVNETMYLTYTLDNNGSTSGLTTSISCQNYVKITNKTSGPKDIDFRLIGTDLLPYMRKIESSNYDGYGFHARNFKLVYQKVSDPAIRPDSGSWKTYNFTSTAITSVTGQTIDPKLLENQTPVVNGFNLNKINDALATTFDITLPMSMTPTNNSNILQFGDERLFYGNINTYIGATIFKTMFDISINASEFNATSNPTRSKDATTLPPNIKVSEVGIYDTNKNLVCIGKLSTPVALLPGTSTIMLELSMDF